MKVAIVGAGAMGCLYGAKLSKQSDLEVFLLDVWKEHIAEMNDHGLLVEEDGDSLVYDRLHASSDPEEVSICDLVVVFVKSTLTGQAVLSNRPVFGPNTTVLTLQNGLGNIEQISQQIGSKNVIAGTTAHGATMLGPGKIRHAGRGKTVVGELDGVISSRLRMIIDLFDNVGLETEPSENVIGLIWDKLLVNVGINALTALTGLKNGQLLDHPELLTLLEGAVLEAESIAKAKGITLQYQDPVGHTKEVCKATSENRSSMLQDILNHKQTEINMMNGAIVDEGRACGIKTPINEVLTNLVLFLQKG